MPFHNVGFFREGSWAYRRGSLIWTSSRWQIVPPDWISSVRVAKPPRFSSVSGTLRKQKEKGFKWLLEARISYGAEGQNRTIFLLGWLYLLKISNL